MLSVTRLLHNMGSIFQERTPLPPVPGGIRIDHKHWSEMMDKRIAAGHRVDDHEDELNNKYQQTI